MSHTRIPAFRAMYAVFQIGAKLATSDCGRRGSVRAAAGCESAGVANPPVAVSAAAPAAFFKNVLRSMMCPSLVGIRSAGFLATAMFCGEFEPNASEFRRCSMLDDIVRAA